MDRALVNLKVLVAMRLLASCGSKCSDQSHHPAAQLAKPVIPIWVSGSGTPLTRSGRRTSRFSQRKARATTKLCSSGHSACLSRPLTVSNSFFCALLRPALGFSFSV